MQRSIKIDGLAAGGLNGQGGGEGQHDEDEDRNWPCTVYFLKSFPALSLFNRLGRVKQF